MNHRCHQITVRPLYLGLVLSGESPSSMVFLLLLLFDCCCCCCCCCCGCDSDTDFSDSSVFSSSSSSFSSFSSFSCGWSLILALIMWGFSRFTSDIWTGFRKNSSAPSSKHLQRIRPVSSNSAENSVFQILCRILFQGFLPGDPWRNILRWHDYYWNIS